MFSAVKAACNVCQENNVACVNLTSYHMCFGGNYTSNYFAFHKAECNFIFSFFKLLNPIPINCSPVLMVQFVQIYLIYVSNAVLYPPVVVILLVVAHVIQIKYLLVLLELLSLFVLVLLYPQRQKVLVLLVKYVMLLVLIFVLRN